MCGLWVCWLSADSCACVTDIAYVNTSTYSDLLGRTCEPCVNTEIRELLSQNTGGGVVSNVYSPMCTDVPYTESVPRTWRGEGMITKDVLRAPYQPRSLSVPPR